MTANSAVAGIIEQQADALAMRACGHLLEEHAEINDRFGADAKKLWTDHLSSRVLELSAALAAGDYRLFASGLTWTRTAMLARDITTDDLQTSLQSLRTSVTETLEGEARTAATECIDHAIAALDTTTADTSASLLDAGLSCDKLALQYVQTVVAGNAFPGMQIVLDAVAMGMPIRDAYLKVLLPAQQEVGRLWHLNKVSVAEEHLVSYTTQRLMAVLSTRMPRKPDNGFTAIAGAVSGNVHDIGIRAISYLLEFEGWRTIYLGSDIPRSELPAAVDGFSADVFLLTVALSMQIPATERAIKEIRAKSSYPVKIMIGGNGLAENPDLWRELGADGYASDAVTAIDMAYELAKQDN